MPTTICTFNVNNLFARYKFGNTYPGDQAKKSLVGKDWGYLPIYQKGLFELLSPEQRALAAQVVRRGTKTKYPDVLCLVEVESMLAPRSVAASPVARGRFGPARVVAPPHRASARLVVAPCGRPVSLRGSVRRSDRPSRSFNERHLGGYYDEALLIDSRDFRLIDVAVLSKRPIVAARSHVDDRDGKGYLFSRACLDHGLQQRLLQIATNSMPPAPARTHLA